MVIATVPTRSFRSIDSIDLGQFTLVIHNEDERSGERLAKHVRALIAQVFAEREPLLSILYELEIDEFEVGIGSRKSKNRVKLKPKKGRTLWEKIKRTGAAIVFLVGIAKADYTHVPENLSWACEHVVHICKQQGHSIEIQDKQFNLVEPGNPSNEAGSTNGKGI